MNRSWFAKAWICSLRLGIITFLSLASGACQGEGPRNTTAIRDSAGIEIVESAGRNWGAGEGWTVDPVPSLDLATSGTGEAHQFFRVVDATRLSDGRIAVAQPTEIRTYSPSGEHLATWGRRGEGPGEFGRVSRIEGLAADSLATLDRSLRRVTFFGPDGEVGRMVRLEVGSLRWDRIAILGGEFISMAFDGGLSGDPSTWREGLLRDPMPILAISSAGQIRDTIAVAAGYESFRGQADGSWIDGQAFLGRDSYLAAHENSIIVGDAIGLDYHVVSRTGAIERIVRGAKDLALSQTLLDSERAAFLGDEPSPSILRLLDRQPVPDRLPAYTNLLVDVSGSVWLEEHRGRVPYEASLEPRSWEVFAPDGAWLGQVSLPGRFSVFEIGADYVLGVRQDEFDVESVQILALQR